MKDINGKEIYIGDKVAFTYCASYADLMQGRVVKITPKQVCIDYGKEKYAHKYPSQVCVVDKLKRDHPEPLDYQGDGYDMDGNLVYDTAICRNCGRDFEVDYDEHSNYCPNCGQALDWEEGYE